MSHQITLKLQEALYNATIRFYWQAIKLGSYFNPKAAKFIKGRDNGLNEVLNKAVINENYIWFHCASLGEFEQGRPIIESLRSDYPHYRILLTFFSPSGFETSKDYEHADEILYLPIDTQRNAQAFVKAFKPHLAVFIKYDFWYHYLKELRKQNIPTVLVSGVFRKEQRFFKSWGSIFKAMLPTFDHFFVQDDHSGRLLQGLGYNNYSVIPDSRVDRVYEITRNAAQDITIQSFVGNALVVIGGSTYEIEEDWLLKLLDQYEGHVRIIIAPHNPSQARIESLKQKAGDRMTFYSSNEQDLSKPIMVVDQIGLLNRLYRYGHVAVIGGGFEKSIHNILEPAAFGLPIIFGPKYDKFNEAHDLIRKGGAFAVEDFDSFYDKIQPLIEKGQYQEIGSIGENYILQNRGGSDQVLSYVKQFLIAK